MQDHTQALREALQGFLDFHTNPAGISVELITEKELFSQAMADIGKREDALIEAARAALSSHHEDGGRAATPGVARKQLLVDVFFQQEGDEPFICAVHGKATVKVLEEIECELVANDGDLYGKGDGIYRMECSRFPGQYGFEGRCEIAPGWEFDEVSFEPEDAPVLDDGVALGGEKGEAVAQTKRDAARYRWLRAGNYPISFARSVLNDTPHGIDASIDAEMSGESRK